MDPLGGRLTGLASGCTWQKAGGDVRGSALADSNPAYSRESSPLTGHWPGDRISAADVRQNNTDLAGTRTSALDAPALRHPIWSVAEGGRVSHDGRLFEGGERCLRSAGGRRSAGRGDPPCKTASAEAGWLAVGFADSFDGLAEEGDAVGAVIGLEGGEAADRLAFLLDCPPRPHLHRDDRYRSTSCVSDRQACLRRRRS